MIIYIWGTGRLAGAVIEKVIRKSEIAGFIDNDTIKKTFMGKEVLHPEELREREYDVVLVGTVHTWEIYEQSKTLQLDMNKIFFVYNNFILNDRNADYSLAEKVFGKEYCNIIKNRYLLIRKNENTGIDHEIIQNGSEIDYVRIETFKLAAEEIRQRNVSGNVAEVGVFRGEFAWYINSAFPEKKCYLFDTFEGFLEKEAKEEVAKGNATRGFLEAYKNTNIKYVMEKMIYPERIVIKKGAFPESLEGLEETFAFVSVDVDFEDSIYDCLEYFYPRMSEGGIYFCT